MDTYRETETGPADKHSPKGGAKASAGFVPVLGAPPASLHLRLTLFVAGAILPVLILAAFVVYDSYVRARDESADRVLRSTQSAMAAVDRELQNQISALQVLALEPALVDGKFEVFRTTADRFLQVKPGSLVAVSDSEGNQVFNSRVRGPLAPWADQDTWRIVVATRKPAISNMYIGAVSQQPTFTVNVPVMRGDDVAYIIGYSPPREIYFEILHRLALPEGWVVSIIDKNAHHVARVPAIPGNKITSTSKSVQAGLAKSDSGIVSAVSIERLPVLTAFTRSAESGWVVAIGMPIQTLDRAARDSLILTGGIGVTLLLFGLLFASHLASQLVRAEAQRSLLMNELNHRVKNTLSAVQSIVARGLPELPANAAYRRAAESRLLALSSAHNILSNQNWESASLDDIARTVISPYGARDRVQIEGADVILSPRIAIPFAMVLNELATNAVKYGALSVPGGILSVNWTLDKDDRLRLEWRETGGPRAEQPATTGYGTKFIERAVTNELKGTVDAAYPREGFTCTIEIPV